MVWVFWFSFAILFYSYLGYPLLLWTRAKALPRRAKALPRSAKRPARSGGLQILDEMPTVSIVLSAFNEEKHIAKKMENLLSLDYPGEKLEILVGSDGSTDGTERLLKNYAEKGIRTFFSTEREGKPTMLNRLVQKAGGEILVFTDARQRIEKEAIRHLVKNFSDPSVGCVSGELLLNGTNGLIGKEVGFYWKYEKFIRRMESEVDSVIGATGALYALRRSLFQPIPEETILDDVVLPMKVVSQGYRTLFEGEAKVFDDASLTPRQEYERKIRTLAGNYQSFVQLARCLNPFKSRVALQFISHKLLRILAPFFLVALFFSNLFLLDAIVYRVLFIGQLLFYGSALLGGFLPKKLRIFTLPYLFCLLNVSALVGLCRYLTQTQKVTWKEQ